MIKKAILAASLLSSPLMADSYWHCEALCEYYMPFYGERYGGLVEILDVDLNINDQHFTQIAKYQDKIESDVNVLESAFNILGNKCFDKGVLAGDLFNYQERAYRPRLVDPTDLSKPVSAETVCVERQEKPRKAPKGG